jgi:hypothetical protein
LELIGGVVSGDNAVVKTGVALSKSAPTVVKLLSRFAPWNGQNAVPTSNRLDIDAANIALALRE